MATAKKNASKAPKIAEAVGELSTKLIGELKAVGVTGVKTEAEARVKLGKLFAKEGLDDISEADTLHDLIAMASAFDTATGDEEEETGKIDVLDDEEETGGEFGGDDQEEGILEAVITLPKKPKKVAATKAKKPVVAKIEDEEEESSDEIADAIVAEVDEKKLTVPKKAVAPKKEKSKKTSRLRRLPGAHWADLDQAAQLKALKPFEKLLPKKEYHIHILQKGFIVKYIGVSAEHNIFKYGSVRQLTNGKLEGFFISHRFKTPDEFKQFLPDDLNSMKVQQGEGCSYVFPFSQESIIELINSTEFLKQSVALATKQDTKMNNNRKKLEAQLLTDKKPAAAVAAPKAAKKKVVTAAKPKAAKKKVEAKKPVPAKKATKKK